MKNNVFDSFHKKCASTILPVILFLRPSLFEDNAAHNTNLQQNGGMVNFSEKITKQAYFVKAKMQRYYQILGLGCDIPYDGIGVIFPTMVPKA